jgi:hypothetical protein
LSIRIFQSEISGSQAQEKTKADEREKTEVECVNWVVEV